MPLGAETLNLMMRVGRDSISSRRKRRDQQDSHSFLHVHSVSTRHSTGMKIAPGFSSPFTTSNEYRCSCM